MSVWYRVRVLSASRTFYRDSLGFDEVYVDEDGSWARLRRGDMAIALWEDKADEGGVASVVVADVRAEADRLRSAGVTVGVVLELHGHVRLVDVFDPDGNRLQLTEEIE